MDYKQALGDLKNIRVSLTPPVGGVGPWQEILPIPPGYLGRIEFARSLASEFGHVWLRPASKFGRCRIYVRIR
jgi:hypothetical protein